MNVAWDDTIVALATPNGVGAIAVIRVSGKDAIAIVNTIFKGTDLNTKDSHTAHFGTIRDGNDIVDEVLLNLFIAPKSYTKENTIEISCHGSPYISKRIIELLIREGCRLAKPGEFTQRAFLNGQMDLAQAEAVADLIASDSAASHKAALSQLRGGFSSEIKELKDKLIEFASLIELELDFSEEDVEFADRSQLKTLITKINSVIRELLASFQLGNAIKNGVPTVIAGKPNAGKSTLLNTLLNEEKAIVSSIAGTTRDFIEDQVNINGIIFRFIDTAGLRETTDEIEAIGVKRTQEKMKEASVVVYLFDAETSSIDEVKEEQASLETQGIPYLLIGNKSDKISSEKIDQLKRIGHLEFISAKQKSNIEGLKNALMKLVSDKNINDNQTIVTNIRHYESLLNTEKALVEVLAGLDNLIPGDLLALDIRNALHYLGEITGEITTDDLLDNIFRNFCIGK